MKKVNLFGAMVASSLVLGFASLANAACIKDGEVIEVEIETYGRNIYDKYDRKSNTPLKNQDGSLLKTSIKAIGDRCKMLVFDADNSDLIGTRISFVVDGKTKDSKQVIDNSSIVAEAEEFLNNFKEGKSLNTSKKAKNESKEEEVQAPSKEEIAAAEKKAVEEAINAKPQFSKNNSIIRIIKPEICESFAKWLKTEKYAKGSEGFKKFGDITNYGASVSSGVFLGKELTSGQGFTDFYQAANVKRNALYRAYYALKGESYNRHLITVAEKNDAGDCLGLSVKNETPSTVVCSSVIVDFSEETLDQKNCAAMSDVKVVTPAILKMFLEANKN